MKKAFWIIFTPIAIWLAVWLIDGETVILATYDGRPLKGASVYIDDQRVGETPYRARLLPGRYLIEITCPEGTETAFAMRTIEFISLCRGLHFTAKFNPVKVEALPEESLK